MTITEGLILIICIIVYFICVVVSSVLLTFILQYFPKIERKSIFVEVSAPVVATETET